MNAAPISNRATRKTAFSRVTAGVCHLFVFYLQSTQTNPVREPQFGPPTATPPFSSPAERLSNRTALGSELLSDPPGSILCTIG